MKRWLIVGVIGVVLVVGGYFLLPEGSPAKVFMARMMSPLQSLFSSGDGTQRREPEVQRQRDPLTELKSRLPMDKKADRHSGVMTGSSVKPVVVANQARREVAVPTPVAEVAVSTAVIDEPAVSDPVAVTQVPVEPMPAADTRRTVIKPEVVVVGGGGVQVKMITPLAPPAQTAEVESSAGQEQAADVSPTVGEAVVVAPVE
jgi:hypothetical protein